MTDRDYDDRRDRDRDRDDDRGRGRDRDDDRSERGRDRDDDRGRGRDGDRGGRDDDRRGRDRGGEEPVRYGTDDAMRRRAEQTGGNFEVPFKSGVEVWRPTHAESSVRICPPSWPDAEHHGLDVWMHSFVGSNGATFICPKKMKLSTHCDACDEADALKKAGEDDDADAIKAKQKIVCYVIDRDDRKPKPKVWTMSWTQDRDIAQQCKDGSKYLQIAGTMKDPRGYDLHVHKTGKGLGTRYTFNVARHESNLEERQADEDEILEFIEKNPLPDVLKFADTATIKEALDGNYNRDRKRGRDRDDDDRGRGRDRDDDRGRGRGRDDDDRRGGRDERRGGRDEGRERDRDARRSGRDEEVREERGGRGEREREDTTSRRGERLREGREGSGRDRDEREDRGGREERRERPRDREEERGRDDRGRDREESRDRERPRDRDEDRGRDRDRR